MKRLSTFLIRLLLGLFVIALLISLVRTIWTSYQALQNIKEEERLIELLEQETRELEEEVLEATSSFELERRARENLRLQREGESVIQVEQ
ncbi:septum formation initiator family protein [Candidatus Woesebacteria bacterium]|nr:septum formation initiator family protein [Candidatus Woesebacteria bacterium]MCD8507409.1 septum formation initiator family protein [Candidatus Woesebacteria bacterium]MCD8527348.1 septum formation initiator family protein [Candidatus Woesebacteria bacterium]MCD8546095.1 septum formation initiator family protein [Candidatus Woesebacteria bacterium]